MTFSRRLPLAFSGLVLIASGCATSIPMPTDVDLDRMSGPQRTASLADLQHGRELYLGRCGSCHAPIEPARFQASAWRGHVLEMKQRAKLSDRDVDLMSAYLEAIAGRPGQPFVLSASAR
jgi:mono/diheme cytochrome c family protein